MIVGRVSLAPYPIMQQFSTRSLQDVIDGLRRPIADLEVLIAGYENRLRDIHAPRTGDAGSDYNYERDTLLTEMALASTLLVQLKASIETGKEVLG